MLLAWKHYKENPYNIASYMMVEAFFLTTLKFPLDTDAEIKAMRMRGAIESIMQELVPSLNFDDFDKKQVEEAHTQCE